MTEVSVETCFLNLKVLSFSSISSNNPLKTEVCRNVVEAAKRNGTHRKNRKLPVSTDMVRTKVAKYSKVDAILKDLRISVTVLLGFAGFFRLPQFSLIRDCRKQNTHGKVSEISVNHTCYRQTGSKSTNHSPLA